MKLLVASLTILVFVAGCNTLRKADSNVDHELVKAATAPRGPVSKPQLAKPGEYIDPIYMRTQADYHYTLAETYSLDGDVDRAIEEYKLTLVYDPNSATVRLKLANELSKKGMITQAVEQAETSLQMKPDYNEARLLLGTLYSSFKLYDKALDQYRSVLRTEPENMEAGLYIGALLAEQKKYGESIAQFQKLTKIDSPHQVHLAWYYMGRVYLEQGKDKEAEQSFLKALESKPDFAEGVMSLGYFYEQKNQTEKAVKQYKAFQEKYGPSAKIAQALGRIYMEEDEYDLAYKQFELLESMQSDNLNIKVKMALILIEQKKFEPAVKKLKEILAVAGDAEKIRFYLAAVYEEMKRYEEAIEQFQTIGFSSTLYSEATIHSAYLYKLLNEPSKAISTMETALQKRGDIAQFYSFYSSLLDDQKQYSRAVDILNKGVSRFPKDDQLYFYLGSMQDKAGDRVKSIASMKRVLELNQDHVQALNYLGYTLADMNEQLDDAEKYVRRALKLKPEDGYITDSLGWVLFKKGNVREAVATLEKAYSIKPNESIIAEHLGDAYFRFSLKNKARQMYLRAVALETNAETIEKIKQKIANIDAGDRGRKPASTAASQQSADQDSAP